MLPPPRLSTSFLVPTPLSPPCLHLGPRSLSHPSAAPLLRRPCPRFPRCLRFPTACQPTATWQDAVFGSEPPLYTPLSILSSGYPHTHVALHPHSVPHPPRTLYAASQTLPSPTATPPNPSRVFPLPLPRPDLALCRELLAPQESLPTPPSAACARTLLPPSLTRILRVSDLELRDHAAATLTTLHPPRSRASLACAVLTRLRVELAAAVVELAPAIPRPGLVSLQAALFVRAEPSTPLACVDCTPTLAVTLAAAAAVPAYMPRTLFDAASVALVDGSPVLDSEEAPVPTTAAESPHGPVTAMWELRAEDVLCMSTATLRAQLAACGVPLRTDDDRDDLLRRAVALMDEVQRREVGIALAAERGLYGVAGQLQKGRSRRGRLLLDLREAEEQARWVDVVRLGMELRAVEEGIADVTAEPGSYDPYLDRDHWYRPSR